MKIIKFQIIGDSNRDESEYGHRDLTDASGIGTIVLTHCGVGAEEEEGKEGRSLG